MIPRDRPTVYILCTPSIFGIFPYSSIIKNTFRLSEPPFSTAFSTNFL